jgi:hypothetical protein
LSCQRHHHIRILLGLLDHNPVVSKLLQKPRIGSDRSKIEANLRWAQPWIELPQGQQGFQSHSRGVS